MSDRPRILTAAAIIAVLFGTLTIISGGRALISPGAGVVPFVLWFNYIAGFAYIAAGIGLWRGSGWAAWLAGAIALATAAVFLGFLWHVAQGGGWMGRTMGAMTLRTAVWSAIAIIAFRRRGIAVAVADHADTRESDDRKILPDQPAEPAGTVSTRPTKLI